MSSNYRILLDILVLVSTVFQMTQAGETNLTRGTRHGHLDTAVQLKFCQVKCTQVERPKAKRKQEMA